MTGSQFSGLEDFAGSIPTFFPTYRGEERNRTSMLLALLMAVRPFSIAVFSGMTHSASSRTVVDARMEPSGITDGPGAPDGVVSIRFGALSPWRCLIEVKSLGDLDAEQIQRYYKAAQAHGLDHVLTISRAIRTTGHPSGFEPLNQLNQPGLSHLSWLEIDNSILRALETTGAGSELSRQERMLLEDFHRYLKRSAVETVDFQSLGSAFNRIRKLPGAALRQATHRKDVNSTASSWLEVITAEALRLTSYFNQKVSVSGPSNHQIIVRSLSQDGRLFGTFKSKQKEGGRVTAELDISARRLRLAWMLNLDDALTSRTRAQKRWELVEESLALYTNSNTSALVRGGPRERLAVGPVARVKVACSGLAEDGGSRPRAIEVHRVIALPKMQANNVAARLHSALCAFAPWSS